MPIRMKALRSFGYPGVNEGPVSRGHEFSVRNEHRARDLETQDPALAYRIEAKLPPKVNPEMARAAAIENKAADSGPFVSAGGKTGAGAPQPSSHQAPQRRRRQSRSSADDSLS